MGEWKLISRPPGKKAARILQRLGGGGCFWTIILLPLRILYVAWRTNVLYNWEGVWTDGQYVSVRVFLDGKSISETLINAFIRGTAWTEETNDALLIRNKERPTSSFFGDVLVLVATGNAKFPPVDVLDAEETWRRLQEEIEIYKQSGQQTQRQGEQAIRKKRATADAEHILEVEAEVERLRNERGKGGG